MHPNLPITKDYSPLGKNFLIKKYCNVGMTQQWSLAKKDKKSDVGLVTG